MDVYINEGPMALLKGRLLRFGFLNLFILAVLGLGLRSYVFSSLPLDYGNLLHGHSHFAFGGWLMPMMVWIVLQYFPSIASKVSFHHWRNMSAAILFSAYGMLLSFPYQGYGPVSIVFSTMAVFAGFYLAFVLFKASWFEKNNVSVMFLRWGLIYMVLSAIGPFATGPLIAMGKQGSPVYFDAIYFYLHFQYNGWFVFVVLGVLYRLFESTNAKHGRKVFYLFNLACLPAYFLSVLWHQPPAVFYWLGGLGAVMQLAGVVYLAKDFLLLKEGNRFVKQVLVLVMMAFVLKSFLQVLSAIPFFADMAYQNRNLVIAYLHLVLLGFVSLFVIATVLREVALYESGFKKALVLFIAGYVITEVLLVTHGLGLMVNVGWLLFAFSLLLVVGASGMAVGVGTFNMEHARKLNAKNAK